MNCTHDTVLRFLPPYIATERDVDTAVKILGKIFAKQKRSAGMNRNWLFCAALAVPLACQAQTGWVSLFDGKSMAGWENTCARKSRRATPGQSTTAASRPITIHALPKPLQQDLYRDFELEFEWRVAPGANSGVKYRIQDRVFLANHPMPKFEDLVNYSVKNRPPTRPDHGQEYVIGFETRCSTIPATPMRATVSTIRPARSTISRRRHRMLRGRWANSTNRAS